MILGENTFSNDPFAYADHVNVIRQIWTIICKKQDPWVDINKIEPLVKECSNAN